MRDLGERGSELQWREVEIFSLRGEGNKIKLNIGTLRYVSVSDEVRDRLRGYPGSEKESFGFRYAGLCEPEESDEREFDAIKE